MSSYSIDFLASARVSAAAAASAFQSRAASLKATLLVDKPKLVDGQDPDQILNELLGLGEPAIDAIESVILAGILLPEDARAWRAAHSKLCA